MKVSILGAAVVAGTAFAADVQISSNYREVIDTGANLVPVTTPISVEALPDVGTRLYHFDAQQTASWEFVDAGKTQVSKIPSLVGERYAYLARGADGGTWTASTWPTAPTLTTDPTLGGGKPCVDFGALKSGKGLVFNAVEGTNLLNNVGTVFMVLNSENGGGSSLLGGGYVYYGAGYGNKYASLVWKRGTTKLPNGTWDFTDYTIPNARWYNGGGTDCANPFFYNGVIWQDGLATTPKRTGLNGGWQVLAINPQDTSLNFGGFALGPTFTGSGNGDSNNSGGQRLAEVIVYDAILSDAQIAEVERYLGKKWFGRVPAGYDDTARIASVRAEQPALRTYLTNGAEVDVTVDAGKTLEIGQFQGGHGGYPKVTKNGEGTLAIDDISSYQGTLVMNGGTFRFEKRDIPTSFPDGIYADMDANAPGRLDYVEENGKKFVTNWVSSTGIRYKFSEGANDPTYEVTLGSSLLAASYPERDFRPTLNEKALGGRKTVDFGTKWEWGPALHFVAWDASKNKFVAKEPAGITTAFMVVNAQGVGGMPLGKTGGDGTNENYFEPQSFSHWYEQKLHVKVQSPQGLSAESNTAFYVNGVRRAPTAGYMTPGWQVVALQGPGSVITGLGQGWSAYYGGGFEMAECVLFNRKLSEREILDVQAMLSKKWFNRETPGYCRVDARTAVADVPKMKVTAPSTVYVAEGDTMRVGELTLAATLVKTGKGTLEIESLAGGKDHLVLSEGLVKGAAAPAQTATCEPALDPSAWLDANDIGGTDFHASGRVRMWHGKDGRNCGFAENNDNAPELVANGLNGMPVVDFLGFNSWRYMVLGTPMDSVRTIFVVGEFYQGGNLLGTRTRADDYRSDHNDFFRNNGTGQPIVAMNDNNRQVWGDGSYIRVDGEPATFDWKPVEGEHHLIEVRTMAGCYGAALMYDNYTGASNGGKIAEIIVYERALTEREAAATRNYLMKKWFNRAEETLPPADDVSPVALAKVEVAAGQTLTLDEDTDYSITEIAGAGTIVKNGDGDLAIAKTSGFTGEVQVNGGKLKLTAQAAPQRAEGNLELWFDANEGISFEDGSDSIITNWTSQATETSLAARALTYARAQMTPPTLVPNGLNGLPYVNFDRGQYFRFIRNDGSDAEVRLTDIKTAFWVIGSQNNRTQAGGGCLFGDSKDSGSVVKLDTFRRATTICDDNPNKFPGYYPSDPLLASEANADVKAAGWRRNAEGIDPLTTGLSGKWDIVSLSMADGKQASADGLAYVGGQKDNQWCCGFQQLAEVLVYNRRLSAEEINATESYLAQKWGLDIGGIDDKATNGLRVKLAEGAELESLGRSRYVDSLDGEGTVTGEITLGGLVADSAREAIPVNGTLTIPEGVKVTVVKLSADGWTPIVRATAYEGVGNLASAVFVGEDADGLRLRVRRGVLGVAPQSGLLMIVK